MPVFARVSAAKSAMGMGTVIGFGPLWTLLQRDMRPMKEPPGLNQLSPA
jgi:hypothetical protein